ncbi:MAG: 23S rRNA (uracil(1939)-C(5))-methyltransferase RlmD [Clostridiales bacterium]|nr:23S rRNA (uracil(1939)-C(5))-methyltransferase RlmD [Clostridiales bacterium]
MNRGDQVRIQIQNIGTEGQGIGRVDGMVVFVPGTFPGDEAEIRITEMKKNYATGSLDALITPSPDRTVSQCPHTAACGGCKFQALSYPAQLAHKEIRVREALRRIGEIPEPKVLPIAGMADPCEYRNKAQFPVSGDQIGYYREKSHQIVPIESCMLQAPPAVALAKAFRSFLKDHPKNIYRHLVVRTALTGEVMAVLVANKNDVSRLEELAGRLDDAVTAPYSLESLILNVNKKADVRVLGPECITLAGKPAIRDILKTGHGQLSVEVSPLSFYQVNPSQMSVLYDKVYEYADLKGTETVLDLYCGVGSIGLSLAGKADRVIGVESIRTAVLDANRNAVLNGIVNAEFIWGKAEEILDKRLTGLRADLVILDPPRQGCATELLDSVAALAPEKVIYVSCNPATLARDVKRLGEKGYRFAEAQPVDMFPWTGHVECVTLMSRVEK